MKIELPVILALAATLACNGGHSNTDCEPGGCWMIPVDFDKAAELLRERSAKRLEIQKSEDAHCGIQSLNSSSFRCR